MNASNQLLHTGTLLPFKDAMALALHQFEETLGEIPYGKSWSKNMIELARDCLEWIEIIEKAKVFYDDAMNQHQTKEEIVQLFLEQHHFGFSLIGNAYRNNDYSLLAM